MSSKTNLKEDEFLRQLNLDNTMLAAWVEDTLQPSLDIYSLRIAIGDILLDIQAQEAAKGVTKRTTEAKEKFEKILKVCERLDKIANQNNTFQLVAKHSLIELGHAKQRIAELEKELEGVQKAWEQI